MNGEKIILAGGSGSLGKFLADYFASKGHEIVVLTRASKPAKRKIRFVQWDGRSLGDWSKELDGSLCVINLAGRSVNCRYTEKNKEEIISSRVDSTAIIGKAIQNCSRPLRVWINASSAAIYGNTETVTDENSSFGSGFFAEVCKKWEAAFAMAETAGTRKAALRIGLVLSAKGGVLEPLIGLAKWHLAGTIGSGRQYMSWIHENDFGKLVEECLRDERYVGAINACSPHPVTNKEFMRSLRLAIGKPLGLPSPALLVRIGAFFMGTEAELVLYGRRVVSGILRQRDFQFQFPEINEAMKNILEKTKNKNGRHQTENSN